MYSRFYITLDATQDECKFLHDMVPEYFYHTHFWHKEDGTTVGVVWTTNSQARKVLAENYPHVIVSPPLHRPLKPEHHEAFGKHCHTLEEGDTPFEFGEKMFELSGLHFFHPEENPW